MNISQLGSVTGLTEQYKDRSVNSNVTGEQDFQSVFANAMNMVSEANELQNIAEETEIKFALGEGVNAHDLAIAQEKANIALQYTVAVKNKFMDAYKEIMNMQI